MRSLTAGLSGTGVPEHELVVATENSAVVIDPDDTVRERVNSSEIDPLEDPD